MTIRKTLLSFLVLFAATYAFGATPENAGGANNAGSVDIVKGFLQRTPLSPDEQSVILAAVQSSSSDAEWLAAKDGARYILALRPIQKSNSSGVRARFEDMARNAARLRAYSLLYLSAMPESRKARYADKNIVAQLLVEWDKRREEDRRLKMDLMVTFSEEWGFAVSRIQEERLNALGEQIGGISETSLDEAYCKLRASQARRFFGQKRYVQAAAGYGEVQDFGMGESRDYLDMSECFLRMGDPKNAIQTVLETVTKFDESLNSLALERAADICLESGDDLLAERYYLQASEKLHTEQ
jgi:hypothetical protein